jgi:hypothetical protein
MDNLHDIEGASAQRYTVPIEDDSISTVTEPEPGGLPNESRVSHETVPYQQDQQLSLVSGTDNDYIQTHKSALDPKRRKRTKSGCLTCRKRRIKCGEEQPTCVNCIKSKRQCEGYNQRIVFKSPLGEWPNHPGVVRELPSHSFFLPGTRDPVNQTLLEPRKQPGVVWNDTWQFMLPGRPRSSGNPTIRAEDHNLTPRRPRPLTNFDFSDVDVSHVELDPIPSTPANGGENLRGIQCIPVYSIGTVASGVVVRCPDWSCASRDSDACMKTGLDNIVEDTTNDLLPEETRAFSPSREALPPSIEETASLLSDAVSTDNSSLESQESMSTEEENEPSPMGAERHKVVDRVMNYFYTIFQAMPAVSQKGREESQKSSSQTASNSSIDTSIPTSALVDPLNKRMGKHPRRNNDQDHSDEEDDQPPKRPKKEKVLAEPKNLKQKFACPYFQRDPEKYLTRRSCVGPGWDEMRRVK